MTDHDILKAFPLRRGDGMTASIMARNMRWPAADIEPAMARLAKAGLIVFTGTSPDVAGNVETVYQITDKGRDSLKRGGEVSEKGKEKAMGFKKATKAQAKLRAAVFGPSGAGKTFTSLRVARGLGGKIAVIDTERGSASKYSDRFDFDVLELEDQSVEGYCEAIKMAKEGGYNVLIIDSLSHAWQTLLEEVEKLAKAKYRGNTWSAWSEGTPLQRKLVQAILGFPGHILATIRAKTEWTTVENSKGQKKPQRVGLAPEQGKGIEYEFDLLLEISTEHIGNVIKDRTGKFQDKLIEKPGEDFGKALAEWLSDGTPAKSYEVEERAAIMEHDGGLPKAKAERMAERQESTKATVNHGTIAEYIAAATAPRTLVKIRERVEVLASEGTLADFERADLLEKIETAMDAMRQQEGVTA